MSLPIDPVYAFTTFISIVVILDPPGSVPVFLALTGSYTREEKHAIARRASLTALGVLVAFAIVGEKVLAYLHVSIPALQVAGGLLLLLIGLELVMGRGAGTGETDARTNIALVPLAVPLYAGPGAMVALMVAVRRADGWPQYLSVYFALVVAMFLVWLSMRYAGALHRFLGQSGTDLVTRIAGILCTAIAVQMIGDGVLGFVRQG